MLQDTQKSLSELARPYQAFPQVLINVNVTSRPDLSELTSVASLAREIEEQLGEDGRVLLRYSGTEPLARIMVEGPDEDWIRKRAQKLSQLIAKEIGS